ncbi:SMI1/KNR4 family protein [Marinagarivorans algicola]|uniref:SMI1/KNR4 family protein n=1 Tax=Marinagarivorans algicola TaxID=1513270 RepID=UPI0006B5CFFC|nr:SMI1/KNR4 family protein [Marinagarivorans algicola]
MKTDRINKLINERNEIFRADYLKENGQEKYDVMMSLFGGNIVDTSEKASDDFIALMEKKLNVTFCKDYCDYLLTFGYIDKPPADRYVGISSDDEAEFKKNNTLPQIVEDTQEFIENVYKKPLKNTTLLYNEQDEWYVLMDHDKAVTVPYDPFAKKIYWDNAKPLENFLLAELEIIEDKWHDEI